MEVHAYGLVQAFVCPFNSNLEELQVYWVSLNLLFYSKVTARLQIRSII